MRIERVDNPGDERLVDYQGVSDPMLLQRRGLFVAEGRLVVKRLIEDRRWRLRSLLVSETALAGLGAARDLLSDDTPIFMCRPADVAGITGYDLHRGCLALAERQADPPVDELLDGSSTLLLLEAVGNPDNVGGAFRNAAAFGVDAVLLSPACADPLYRKANRTSMAATLRVPFAWMLDWPDGLERIRAAGFVVAALTPREPADDLATVTRASCPARLAVVAGNEGSGLTPDVERRADVRIRIPVRSDVDSLNVAVAVGVALYALQSGYTV